MRKFTIVFLLALLGVVTACGSGGGDGGAKNFAVGFTPDVPAPAADSVSMAEGAASGDQVLIDINVTDTGGVYGAEGAVWIGVSGSDQHVEAAATLITSVAGEPPCVA